MDNVFSADSNWVGGAAPGNSSGSNLDTATFFTSNRTAISFSGSNYFLGSILFGSNVGPNARDASGYMFGAASSSFELAFSASNSPAYPNSSGPGGTISINSAVTQAQTFNVKLALTPGSFSFANNSMGNATLNFRQQIRSTNTSDRTSTLTLTGSNTLANTISGNIVNGGGAGMIVNKTDTGSWVLSGTGNTYTGGTTINGGKLLVANASGSGTGTGSVSIGVAGTLASGAGTTGAIAGLVSTAGTGSTFAPGATSNSNVGTVGQLTLSGGLNLTNGASIAFDLGGSSSTSDLIRIMGGTFIGSGTGSVTFNFNDLGVQPGTYKVIDFTGATANGVDPGDFVAMGIAGTFSVTGTEVDFITAVPEPGTVLAGLLATGALGWHGCRRLRARRGAVAETLIAA